MRIDAHQHFWNYTANPNDFAWMTDDLFALQNNFLPQDLEPLLSQAGYEGTIAVQAREMEVETDFLLKLANNNSIIKGVVGWVDLCSTNVKQSLERYADDSLLKGFRMIIHDHADLDFANSEVHARGIGYLEQYGWTYDLLLKTIHLPSAIQLVDRYPTQKFVVDHIAKPANDKSDWDAWLTGIRTIAERTNVFCKLSGLVTEGDWKNWKPADFTPFLEEVLKAFSIERLMIGSDWPVCTLAADYGSAMNVVENWAGQFNIDEREALFGRTCARFYDVT
jgi:L-fuconolactonase